MAVMTTDGQLLGGRVLYRQAAGGFRSGIEPVLLAASVPVRPGEHVLEAGTGCGAALLCISARVPGVRATGVEIDPTMAALAAVNAAANGYGGIAIIPGRIETAEPRRPVDHAIANPPYHPPSGTASADPVRDLAKRAAAASVGTWIDRLAAPLRERGSLTLIVRAAMIPHCLEAMGRSRCPCAIVFPLWPMSGRPAKLVMLRGVKYGRTPMRLAPGIVLHRPDGSFTETAQRILRDGLALTLDASEASANA